MKRFFVIILLVFFSLQTVFANIEEKDYSLKFNGTNYRLLYSVKNNDFGGYLNEYYRLGETYNIWSDMVAVHHFPNAYSPIDRIKDFKEYLSEIHVPSSLTFDDKKNSAMIDFVMITNNQLPVVLEFNVFKYEKSNNSGSLAVQYVKRYTATTTREIEEIKKEFTRNRTVLIKKVKKFKIPDIVTYNIDRCISIDSINNSDTFKKETENFAKNINSKDVEQVSDDNTETLQTNNVDSSIVSDSTSENEEIYNADNNRNIQNTDCIETSEDNTNITEKSEPKKISKPEINTNDLTLNSNSDTNEKPKNASDNSENLSNNKTNNKIKDKKIKEASYTIANEKQKYIATPRTNKELKKQTKELKKKQKEENADYNIVNTNCELIAVPRTKKDLREYKKELDKKRKIKERAMKAQKMLKENY